MKYLATCKMQNGEIVNLVVKGDSIHSVNSKINNTYKVSQIVSVRENAMFRGCGHSSFGGSGGSNYISRLNGNRRSLSGLMG